MQNTIDKQDKQDWKLRPGIASPSPKRALHSEQARILNMQLRSYRRRQTGLYGKMSDPAARAKCDVSACKSFHQVNSGEFFDNRKLRTGEQFAYCQFLPLDSRSEKTIVPDFRKPRRQDVNQESPDKLFGIQLHDFLFSTVFVIPPLE